METFLEMAPVDESHASVKFESALSGPTTSDPEFARDPVQAPLAVQLDISEPFHVKVTVSPLVTAEADVVSVRLPTIGAVGGAAVSFEPPHPARKTREPATVNTRESNLASALFGVFFIFRSAAEVERN